jgi:hypothetical protein
MSLATIPDDVYIQLYLGIVAAYIDQGLDLSAARAQALHEMNACFVREGEAEQKDTSDASIERW